MALHTDYGWAPLETWNSLDKLDLWSARDARVRLIAFSQNP